MKFDFDIIIFTSGPKAYAPKRLQEEGKILGLKLKVIKYKEINLEFETSGFKLNFNGKKMPSSRAVFLRGLGEDPIYNSFKTAIISWYKKNKSKVLNLQSFTTWPSLDKTTQYINLTENKLPVVKSYAFGSSESLTVWAKDNYPFVAKDIIGSCGVDVFKIKNNKDLRQFFDKGYNKNTKIKTLMFQHFLISGEDLRVIILEGKVLGAMKRIAKKGEFLTNYSQGGIVEKYDISKDLKVKKLALSVSKLFKLDYCGVDLMKDNVGNWVVLEVNRACQFEGFEKSTRINVAGNIVEFLTK